MTHDMSGFIWSPLEVIDGTDRIATGDPGMRFEEIYLGWNESRLTQEQAAWAFGVPVVPSESGGDATLQPFHLQGFVDLGGSTL